MASCSGLGGRKIWDYLTECSSVPAMWNAFPFHPHKANNLQSNRPPNHSELRTGKEFVQLVLDILTPHTVIAVGAKSAEALSQWFQDLDIESVRHPSHGGKSDFLTGIEAVGIV